MGKVGRSRLAVALTAALASACVSYGYELRATAVGADSALSEREAARIISLVVETATSRGFAEDDFARRNMASPSVETRTYTGVGAAGTAGTALRAFRAIQNTNRPPLETPTYKVVAEMRKTYRIGFARIRCLLRSDRREIVVFVKNNAGGSDFDAVQQLVADLQSTLAAEFPEVRVEVFDRSKFASFGA